MKKELIGWLDVRWEDTALYPTEEALHYSSPSTVERLTEQLEEFRNKKVKITIEVIE